MSWAEAIVWSFCRSILVASAGTLIASVIQPTLRQFRPARQGFVWGALLLPFFVPSLMTGYCYRDTSMALVHTPLLREMLYACIVLMQAVPVATVILAFAPRPATSPSALLLARRLRLSRHERWRLLLGSEFQYRFASFSLLFLISFQEADLAALMQAAGWTEWMFTKHAGGLPLAETIRRSLWPIAIQLPFLAPLVVWLGSNSPAAAIGLTKPSRSMPARKGITICWIAVSHLLVILLPAWQLVQGAGIGLGSLLEQPSIPREIGDGVLLAMTSGGLAMLLSLFLTRLLHRGSYSCTRSALLVLVLLPCSLGNLALGLVIAGIFQTSMFELAYDTPLPLILGEVIFLLPRTLILLSCTTRISLPSAHHMTRLLNRSAKPQQRSAAAELHWQTSGRNWLLATLIIFFWAYFEVLLPSILAMPGLAPVGLVLYNNMHYGRIAALGAKLALMLFVPFVFAVIMLRWGRFLFQFNNR